MKRHKLLLEEENEFEYLDNDVSDLLRKAIIDEHEAIRGYNEIIRKCPVEVINKVLKDIANEEKVHVHELEYLLHMYDEYEETAIIKADREIDDMLK